MQQSASARKLVCNGYYDLPRLCAAEYTFIHLYLPAETQSMCA
ncbi:MAG: hypothetical protein R2911_36310 [Caldilineaceae bacterium]